MTAEYARKTKPFTVRSLDLGHILRQSGLKRWAELASLYA
jgi:predicted alpha/beta hydrolase family esterase